MEREGVGGRTGKSDGRGARNLLFRKKRERGGAGQKHILLVPTGEGGGALWPDISCGNDPYPSAEMAPPLPPGKERRRDGSSSLKSLRSRDLLAGAGLNKISNAPTASLLAEIAISLSVFLLFDGIGKAH